MNWNPPQIRDDRTPEQKDTTRTVLAYTSTADRKHLVLAFDAHLRAEITRAAIRRETGIVWSIHDTPWTLHPRRGFEIQIRWAASLSVERALLPRRERPPRRPRGSHVQRLPPEASSRLPASPSAEREAVESVVDHRTDEQRAMTRGYAYIVPPSGRHLYVAFPTQEAALLATDYWNRGRVEGQPRFAARANIESHPGGSVYVYWFEDYMGRTGLRMPVAVERTPGPVVLTTPVPPEAHPNVIDDRTDDQRTLTGSYLWRVRTYTTRRFGSPRTHRTLFAVAFPSSADALIAKDLLLSQRRQRWSVTRAIPPTSADALDIRWYRPWIYSNVAVPGGSPLAEVGVPATPPTTPDPGYAPQPNIRDNRDPNETRNTAFFVMYRIDGPAHVVVACPSERSARAVIMRVTDLYQARASATLYSPGTFRALMPTLITPVVILALGDWASDRGLGDEQVGLVSEPEVQRRSGSGTWDARLEQREGPPRTLRCPACPGEGDYIGNIGEFPWYRCRECRADFGGGGTLFNPRRRGRRNPLAGETPSVVDRRTAEQIAATGFYLRRVQWADSTRTRATSIIYLALPNGADIRGHRDRLNRGRTFAERHGSWHSWRDAPTTVLGLGIPPAPAVVQWHEGYAGLGPEAPAETPPAAAAPAAAPAPMLPAEAIFHDRRTAAERTATTLYVYRRRRSRTGTRTSSLFAVAFPDLGLARYFQSAMRSRRRQLWNNYRGSPPPETVVRPGERCWIYWFAEYARNWLSQQDLEGYQTLSSAVYGTAHPTVPPAEGEQPTEQQLNTAARLYAGRCGASLAAYNETAVRNWLSGQPFQGAATLLPHAVQITRRALAVAAGAQLPAEETDEPGVPLIPSAPAPNEDFRTDEERAATAAYWYRIIGGRNVLVAFPSAELARAALVRWPGGRVFQLRLSIPPSLTGPVSVYWYRTWFEATSEMTSGASGGLALMQPSGDEVREWAERYLMSSGEDAPIPLDVWLRQQPPFIQPYGPQIRAAVQRLEAERAPRPPPPETPDEPEEVAPRRGRAVRHVRRPPPPGPTGEQVHAMVTEVVRRGGYPNSEFVGISQVFYPSQGGWIDVNYRGTPAQLGNAMRTLAVNGAMVFNLIIKDESGQVREPDFPASDFDLPPAAVQRNPMLPRVRNVSST